MTVRTSRKPLSEQTTAEKFLTAAQQAGNALFPQLAPPSIKASQAHQRPADLPPSKRANRARGTEVELVNHRKKAALRAKLDRLEKQSQPSASEASAAEDLGTGSDADRKSKMDLLRPQIARDEANEVETEAARLNRRLDLMDPKARAQALVAMREDRNDAATNFRHDQIEQRYDAIKKKLEEKKSDQEVSVKDLRIVDPALGPRVTEIVARQRIEAERGRGKVDEAHIPLGTMDLHVHGGGSPSASLSIQLFDQPGAPLEQVMASSDFERKVQEKKDEYFYVPPTPEKGLPPYLSAYTGVSRDIPFPQPIHAQMMMHELAYECAASGNIAVEFRINALRDFFSIHTVKGDKSEYSEEYIRAIAAGLQSGSAAAQKDGLTPTQFGIIFDGNRFSPTAKTNEESIKEAKKLVEISFKEAVRQIKIPGNPCMVVGVGLCGKEEDHSVVHFKEEIDIVHAHNAEMYKLGFMDKIIGMSIHAGEVKTDTHDPTDEVFNAITTCWREHTPLRIGHGVLADLDEVERRVTEWNRNKPENEKIRFKDIHFEMCPESNNQICKDINYHNHPSKEALEKDRNFSFASDNRGMSGELARGPQLLGVKKEDELRAVLNGVQDSFVIKQKRSVRRQLRKTIEQYAAKNILVPAEYVGNYVKPGMVLSDDCIKRYAEAGIALAAKPASTAATPFQQFQAQRRGIAT